MFFEDCDVSALQQSLTAHHLLLLLCQAQGKHHQVHYEIIQETLQKQVAAQASTFQVSIDLLECCFGAHRIAPDVLRCRK